MGATVTHRGFGLASNRTTTANHWFHELRPVDEPVPLCNAMITHEASVVPIGRVELERLLRSYEVGSGVPAVRL